MRAMRDEQYQPISMSADDVSELPGLFKRDETSGVVYELLGNDRLEAIIHTLATGGRYTLEPHMDPGEPVIFDYKGLEPSAENIVYALIAAERVWRCVVDPRAGIDDTVQVERTIDNFLRNHLVQFGRLFCRPVAEAEGATSSLFITYSHLVEDAQEDDLTILAIRKK